MKTAKFNRFDSGWLSINFGMAIGAGILMVPVSIGIVGVPLFIVSVLITYPGIYLLQKKYIQTLFASKEPKVYSEVIRDVLGERWQIFLAITYFLMMLIWTTIYAEVIAQTFSDYAFSFELTTNPDIKSNLIFSFVFVVILMFIGFKSQNLLIKSVSIFAIILVISIFGVTVSLAPFWDVSNLTYVPHSNVAIPKLIILIPFSLTSILFIQSLSPMVIAYKKEYPAEVAEKKALKGMKIAFILLTLIVIFFIISFSLTVSHDMAVVGAENNYSGLILLNKYGISNNYLTIFGGAINIFAILTSFLSILAGMRDSLIGLMIILFRRFNNDFDHAKLNLLAVVVIFLIVWGAIVFYYPVYVLLPLSGPIFAIVGCFTPAFIIYKSSDLIHLKGLSLNFVIFLGFVLLISPLLTSFLS